MSQPIDRQLQSQQSWAKSLLQLLPRGYAWSRHPDSNQTKVITGLAGLCSEYGAYALNSVTQWMPSETCTRLDDWETATGLPDQCMGELTESEARRQAIVGKLSGMTGLAYDDSSPAAPGSIETIVKAQLGLDITVTPTRPFRVGQRVGQRLGKNGTLIIRIANRPELVRTENRLHVGASVGQPLNHITYEPVIEREYMRVGEPVGQRLMTRAPAPPTAVDLKTCKRFSIGDTVGQRLNICQIHNLQCVLNQIIPSRFNVYMELN